MKSLQKFASVHASFDNHFNSERHLIDRQTYKPPLGRPGRVAVAVQLNPLIKATRAPVGDKLPLD
jgi:hypothetical protein